jgi:ribosomal protein L7/L12
MGTALAVAALVIVAVVLLLMLRRRERGRELFVIEATGHQPVPRPPDGMLDTEVLMLLRQRKKIQAIKVVREHTRLGLKEAKDIVEDAERTGRLRLPPIRLSPGVTIDDDTHADTLVDARRLKQRGKAIEAVKLIRDRTGWSLKAAKDTYDRL